MSFSETIFLTGFPGFIAERLVARLANADVQFYLLVQKSFVEKAKDAVEKIARNTKTPLENFALIEGDITLENLGMSADDLEIVRRDTTDVFHLAAVYDLAVEKDLAYRVNVEGTRNVNEFVKKLPNLRRYNYVSTCYVAGKRGGEILETELAHDAGFRNYYEETKYLAELETEEMKKDFPITIFRPSVVVGDSKTGETAKYDGIYYLILYLQKFPSVFRLINVGNKDVKLNLVPVDFVVEGMAVLSKSKESIGKTIALADPAPLNTEELFDEIAKVFTGKESVITPPATLLEKFMNTPFSSEISGLPNSAVPYFHVKQNYDTKVGEMLLKPYNVSCPNFREYVANLIRFVEENPKLD